MHSDGANLNLKTSVECQNNNNKAKLLHFAMIKHSYHSLRQARLARATKPFNARGARLIRCERCLLGQAYCICSLAIPADCGADWILLMHEDEVLKPTNTGRLVADVFPSCTQVFEWARTEAPEGLLPLLMDPNRLVVVIFPADGALTPAVIAHQAQLLNRRLTLVLLDGTWKQARKMFNRTPWLASFPCVAVPLQTALYSLRKAAHSGCLSTVEAAIGLLDHLDPAAGQALASYFLSFNQGYSLSRGLRPTNSL